MKISKGDVLKILRSFGIASSENSQKDIDQLTVKHPSPINTGASFRFLKKHFLILFDETAEDDHDYIVEQLRKIKPNLTGILLENPITNIATYGLPYEGKHCYLFQNSDQKIRLDQYLTTEYPEWSRSSWQKLIKEGRVIVDGETIILPSFAVSTKNNIEVNMPTVVDTTKMKLPVVEMNEHIIAVDKPAGVLTHSKNQLDSEFTVADFFRQYTESGSDDDRAGIVHRLDRDTSGVIVGARNEATSDWLKKAFADRRVLKTYYAIVDGRPKQPHFIIDLPILRNSAKPGSFMVHPSGKSAKTTVKLLSTQDNLSLLELTPETGRTHQLRVHLAHIGTPIHGDRLYGKSTADRMYLHAYAIEIPLPDGSRQKITAKLPSEFTNLVSNS